MAKNSEVSVAAYFYLRSVKSNMAHVQEDMENCIMAQPTGECRNKMTDINIRLRQLLEDIEGLDKSRL